MIRIGIEELRKLVRETMMNPTVGWQSTSDLSDSPATVSAVVDPSAALTDPGNENFRPSNRKELRAAISNLIDDISDDGAEDFFDAVKDVIDKNSQEDKNMKNDKKVEETIRREIRRILSEAKPKKSPEFTVTNPRGIKPTVVPAGVHGGEWMKSHEKRKASIAKSLNKMDLDKDAEDMVRADAPAAGRERKNVMQTDVGGASFKDIANELGYASESGAKQAAEKAMAKARFASNMDADDLQLLSLYAMKDYIDFLKGSGELTSTDVQLMLDHPTIVSELDGFREFFDKYMKRAMKAAKVSVEEAVDPKAARDRLLKSLNSTAGDNLSPAAMASAPARKELSDDELLVHAKQNPSKHTASDKVNKYVDHLKSSGELSDKEVEILKSRPEHVAELPGFKNFKG
jgi:hypothetical protein